MRLIVVLLQVQSEREDQYFDVLEKKEMYENKLLDTHMIEATLFYCPIVRTPTDSVMWAASTPYCQTDIVCYQEW